LRLDLYVVTSSALSRGRPTEAIVAAALAGGADAIQLREKTLSTLALVRLGQVLRRLTREAGALLIVNDRVDVALAVEADGVHLGHIGQEDMPPDIARRLMGPEAIIGVSAATAEEARLAEQLGADYLGVGPMYPSASKADAGEAVGPERIAELRAACSLPIVGIGGITAERVAPVIRAGASGVAVIGAVVGAEDPAEAARDLKRAIAAARGEAG